MQEDRTTYYNCFGFKKWWSDPCSYAVAVVHLSILPHQTMLAALPVPSTAARRILIQRNIEFLARPVF